MLKFINNGCPILLVEDDQIDALTVERALQELKIGNKLIHVENGEEALDILKSKEAKPAIILLDLNMPKMGGLEFLKIIKQDTQCRSIPVIVLTTSMEKQDIEHSFNQSVAGYMVKPVDYEEFLEKMESIYDYWSNNILPE